MSLKSHYYFRCYVSVTFLDGYIYALGGFDGEHRLKSVECYDPKRNQWMMKASMNHVRSDADATACDGKFIFESSHSSIRF